MSIQNEMSAGSFILYVEVRLVDGMVESIWVCDLVGLLHSQG